jgi:succinoglycan biosynthesis protein ExoA
VTRVLASVLVPTMNEADDIEGCLEAIASQDCGPDVLEVIITDGRSTDATVAIAREVLGRHRFAGVMVIDNPELSAASGLNLALEHASAPHVVRVDSRARVPPHYISTCVRLLEDSAALGVVGGAQDAMPRSARVTDQAIAAALQNRLTMGFSRYRRTGRSGPADTVWMGVFRTDDLRNVGGWPTDFPVNEDYELNRRFRLSGRTVWFEGSLRSSYIPRSTIAQVAQQYARYGYWKGVWWRARQPLTARHVVLLAIPPVAVAALLRTLKGRGLRAFPAIAAWVAAVDTLGTTTVSRPATSRLLSPLLSTAIGLSWWSGVVGGLLRGGRFGPGGDTAPRVHRAGHECPER